MRGASNQLELGESSAGGLVPRADEFALLIVMEVKLGGFRFEWRRPGAEEIVARGLLSPNFVEMFRWFALEWEWKHGERRETDHCNRASSSVRALLKRILKRLPLVPGRVQFGFRLEAKAGAFEADRFYELNWPEGVEWSSFLARPVQDFVKGLEDLSFPARTTPEQRGRAAMVGLLQTRVALPDAETRIDLVAAPSTLRLCVTLQMVKGIHSVRLERWRGHCGRIRAGDVFGTG